MSSAGPGSMKMRSLVYQPDRHRAQKQADQHGRDAVEHGQVELYPGREATLDGRRHEEMPPVPGVGLPLFR